MAADRMQSRQFAKLLRELEPRVRRAFLASVKDLQGSVDWVSLISALEQNDIQGAVSSLNISEAAWQEYVQGITSVYSEAGSAAVDLIKKRGIGGIGLRFQMSNSRAEQWVYENTSELITRTTAEQVETVRQVIERGYAAGEGPRTIAYDIVGRVGPNGTRQGGILGLDGPRAERLSRVSQGMRTPEGVQSLVTKRLDGSLALRYKVNKATGNRILKAYRSGEAVPAKDRLISERQYQSALLKARADTIAATETASAVMNSRDEAWTQAAEEGNFDLDDVIKTWRHRRGPGAGRDQHIEMAGKQVRGLNTPFTLPSGAKMMYPQDPAGGAENNINCACAVEYSRVRRV